MPYLNKATIMGHLGQDAKARDTKTGGSVVNLSIATTEKWKDRTTGEERKITDWHRVAIFGKVAEWAREWRKGDLIYVEGKIKNEKYMDQNGQNRVSTAIHVSGWDSKALKLNRDQAPQQDERELLPPEQEAPDGVPF